MLQRKTSGESRWDITNVVSLTNENACYVPLEKSEKIDTPAWRCLDDNELVGDYEKGVSSEEDTGDEFYERLHQKQNERLKVLIQANKTKRWRKKDKRTRKPKDNLQKKVAARGRKKQKKGDK